MDIKSLLNQKRRLSESDSPPIKRQKLDEEMYSDETLEEDENGSSSDNMNIEEKIADALHDDQEVDLGELGVLVLNETRHFSNIHWDRLWDALKHNTTLTELATGYCYGHDVHAPITDSHCIKLGEALKENNTLRILTLDYHEYTSVGVRYIAEGLKVNKGLDRLEMSENNLDFSAFRSLGEALQVNTTLKELELDRLSLRQGDPADFLFFCEVLKTNTTLQSFSLSDCAVNEDIYEALQEVKKVNKHLSIEMPDVIRDHYRKKPKKKQKIVQEEASSDADQDDVDASNIDAISEGAKSDNEDLQSPSGERSSRRAKLTARASITPLMTKKTRKRRKNGADENSEAKINEIEAKNSDKEIKNQDPAAKVQSDINNDNVKEPITKKARGTKNTLNKTQNNVKSFGGRRTQRRAKLHAKRIIAPLMIKKTRKRRKDGQNDSDEETSKSEVAPTRQQRKAKLLAAASIVPLVIKKSRKVRGSLEEENNNNKKSYSKKNNNTKEEKLPKPRKYKKKQENKEVNSPNDNKNIEIKVPANQRRAKYFARANITPLMIRKTRKRRNDATKEKKEDRSEDNNTNSRERKAKLVAQKSITPLVFKKTRKRRENREEKSENNSPVKEKKEEKVKRGPGRPPKKRGFKGKSASSTSQETAPKTVVPFKPKHKFIRTYQAKPRELPRRLARNEKQILDI